MAITKDSFYKYQDQRGQTGYGAALLVRETSAEKFSMLVASETIPSIFGTSDSVEFDLLNSPTKGKITGKMSLEDKEIEVLHHRDNVYRFEQLKDKVLDFLVVSSDFVGYTFKGTLSYRMNDATSDVLRGTCTITPLSANPTPILDARGLCQETLCFDGVIPEAITSTQEIPLSVVQKVAATYKYKRITDQKGDKLPASAETEITEGKFVPPTGSAETVNGLYAITAYATGYAPWTTTVYVTV